MKEHNDLSTAKEVAFTGCIDGVMLIKELVDYNGEWIISGRTISLSLVEDAALAYYKINETPINRLYIYVQLVKYFKKRGMFLGEFIKIPDVIYQRVRKL